MKKRLITPILLGLGLPALLMGQSKAKPNVILIYADDLGYGDLGCYGAKGVETPNINKLAQQGIRFTNAHAMAATSTPKAWVRKAWYVYIIRSEIEEEWFILRRLYKTNRMACNTIGYMLILPKSLTSTFTITYTTDAIYNSHIMPMRRFKL